MLLMLKRQVNMSKLKYMQIVTHKSSND